MGRFVHFNQQGYIRALESALQLAMEKVEKEVMSAIMNNFGALNIRELDNKFVADMRRAIRNATVRTANRVVTQFRAGYEGTPNQSFRLVYYEYGTGTLMKPPAGYSLADDPTRNPARLDTRIWQRPYGRWKDAGGNEHFSKTRGRPRPLSENTIYGRPIAPRHWFRNGFWEGTKNLDKYLLDAVKSVPISSYISIANIYKRM